jgi:hypothetical protein
MDEKSIVKILNNHEERLKLLEGKKDISKKENNSEINYKEGGVPWLVCELKNKYGFFDNSAIKTTGQIIDMLKIKFDKKITANNAMGEFVKLVKDGILDRERIAPTQKKPKGEYIWFLPGIDKKHLENYKNDF